MIGFNNGVVKLWGIKIEKNLKKRIREDSINVDMKNTDRVVNIISDIKKPRYMEYENDLKRFKYKEALDKVINVFDIIYISCFVIKNIFYLMTNLLK